MAYGEFGTFAPSESLYTQPGAADERARQTAIQKASYLSSMDQFYANLDETIREFNKTYKLQERAATLSEKEQAEASAYRTEQLAWEKEYGSESLELQREQLAQQYQLTLAGYATELQRARIQGTTSGASSGYESSGYLSPYQYEEDKLREAALKGA